jgi:hypothetical protein
MIILFLIVFPSDLHVMHDALSLCYRIDIYYYAAAIDRFILVRAACRSVRLCLMT